jgi:23S rRNA pseudouridine2605 synthase
MKQITTTADEITIRLDKHLSNLGVCSRRDAKQLLVQKNVTVNGKRVKESGTRVDPQKDAVLLNGAPIKRKTLVYYLLNKPVGIISTTADEYNRRNVTALIPSREKIYPVGRLDKDTHGLIILTNDGDLTNRLIHPRYHVYKVYQLTIEGIPNEAQLKAFRTGVLLDDGITAPAKATILKQEKTTTIMEVTLFEGKNRQIRRMCETVGLKLVDLQRIQFGPIRMGNLKVGQYRPLTKEEIKTLKNITSNNPIKITNTK